MAVVTSTFSCSMSPINKFQKIFIRNLYDFLLFILPSLSITSPSSLPVSARAKQRQHFSPSNIFMVLLLNFVRSSNSNSKSFRRKKLHYRPHVASQMKSHSIKSFFFFVFWLTWKSKWRRKLFLLLSSVDRSEISLPPHVREMRKLLQPLTVISFFASLWSRSAFAFCIWSIDWYNCCRRSLSHAAAEMKINDFIPSSVVHTQHPQVINIIAIIEFFRFNWDVMDF